MRTWLRGKITLLFVMLGLLVAVPAVALASDLTGSVVDTTAPTGSVTLTPGNSGNIEINWSVTGKQDGTSTFQVYKKWTLSGGTFTGSDPATVTVDPRPVPSAPATTGTVNGTVSVDSGQSAGGPFALNVTAFGITNSASTAKLSAGTFSTYNVTVQGVTDPCAGVSNPVAPVITATPSGPDGSNGWYTSVPSVSAATTTSGATIEYATKSLPGGTKSAFSSTAPTLGEGTTEVFAKATSATCNRVSESSSVFMVDTVAPDVNPADVVNNTWRNSDLSHAFTSSDATSGLADATNDASFTLTAANESADADTPTVVERPVFDVAGNSTTRSVSAKIDLTDPNVQVTGVSQGGTYTTGNVPTPGCDTTDGLSGVKTDATVNVTGGTGGFGNLTATCSGAEDNAGNTNSASVTYGVSAAFNGFLQPIDGHSVNTGKWGRTYPIKWQLRDSSGALISDTTAQLLLTNMTGGQKAVSCGMFDLSDSDALETATTGGTSLRYDATSDQFIYNYKAPSTGSCYIFAIRNADGLTTQQIDFQFTK